jgi:hypothetical protein
MALAASKAVEVGDPLATGDCLIQPSGTLHAPFSLSRCLLTGSMQWDARDMQRVVSLVKLEVEHGNLANEERPES